MKIQITAPSGVTLLTEKTYCPENIDVIPSLQDKTVTPGEAQTVTPDTGYAGLSGVNVEAVDTEPGAATPSAAAQVITPSAGKFFDQFTVAATPTEQKTIDTNGTFTPSAGKFFDSVTVNVNTAKPEQEKSVDITSMSPVAVTPDAGYTLSKVTATPKAPLANTADATAAAGDILSGKTAYVSGIKVTGTLGTQTKSATPSLVSQTITPDAGNLLSSVTVNAAPLDEAQTVTAGTTAKTVSPTGSNIGIKSVTVNPTPSETKSVTPTTSAQTVTPTSGKLLSSVSVAAIQTETKTVTAGTSATTVTPTSGKFLTSVTVNPTSSEEKTVEITSSGNTVITPSSGKLLSKVTVSPMLESYSVAAEATEKVVTPTDGYAGLSSVTIAAAPLQDITITQATNIAQEFTNPDPGYYGFGKITVPQLTGEEKTVTITENGTTTVNYSDPKLMSKVTITTNVPAIVDVATAAEMNAKLVAGNVGKVYRFTGTTDSTYTNGDLYEVVSE